MVSRARKVAILMSASQKFYQRIQSLFGTALTVYFPMWDAVGAAAAVDLVSGNNGVPNSLTFGQTGIGDGYTSVLQNDVRDYLDIVTAMTAKFTGDEGTFFIFAKPAATTWTDSAEHYLLRVKIDANNFADLVMTVNNNELTFLHTAGGTAVSATTARFGGYEWALYAVTWSKSNNRARILVNGSLYGAGTGLGTWAGTVYSATNNLIGDVYKTAPSAFLGNYAYAGFLNREATAAELRSVFDWSPCITKYIAFIGDSIPAYFNGSLLTQYNSGNATGYFHSANGTTIASHLAGQAAAAATDNADIIILEHGTNDNNAGDMAALQAIVEAAIVALKASNPRATIYYMNVLPRWTDAGGLTEVDKSNIRTMIAAACTAQSITCWDTYSTPWISAAQTADGTHPNAAGVAAIVAAILALLP